MQSLTVTEGIWVFTSALYQTTCTVIRSQKSVLIVDPNWLPEEVDAIRNFVQEIAGDRKRFLLFTHSDYDHIIGYKAFEGCTVIASEAFVKSVHKEADVAEAKKFDLERGLHRTYEIVYPDVDLIVRQDGQQLRLEDLILTCYLAPGHTAEGVFTVVDPHCVLIAGDYLSDVEFPLVQNSRVYGDTLMKLDSICATHEIRSMIPGHGTAASGTEDIFVRRAQALEYLEDLEALSTGRAFPEDIYRHRYAAWDDLRAWHEENVRRVSPA